MSRLKLLQARSRRALVAAAVLIAIGSGTAYAASIPGIDVYYAGVVQGAGWGTTIWDGRPLVSATWADKRANSYSIYANASFYQYRYTCDLGSPCRYAWMFVSKANGPNTTSKVSSYGLRGELSGYSGTYGAYLNICADIPWQADPCASRGRYGF